MKEDASHATKAREWNRRHPDRVNRSRKVYEGGAGRATRPCAPRAASRLGRRSRAGADRVGAWWTVMTDAESATSRRRLGL